MTGPDRKLNQYFSITFLKHISRQFDLDIILALCLLLSYSTLLIAADKPLLSEAIAEGIDNHGVSATAEMFAKSFENDKSAYTVDMEGVANLGKKYMKENNYEASGAVMQIAAPYMQAAIMDMSHQYTATISETTTEKIAEEKVQKEAFLKQERERQKQLDLKQERDLFASQVVPDGKPLIKENISYSGISTLEARNANGSTYYSSLSINHAPKKTRFSTPESESQVASIFRYDKGVLWLVHPERKGYEGVRLYQEFKLASGKGINGHIDALMSSRQALLAPRGLNNLGTETIDGETVTHYYKKERNPGYKYGYNSYDYWVDNNGILIKMQLIAPEVSRTLQIKDITLSSQDEMLFVPPQGYRKAGHNISWKDEKKNQGIHLK